MDTEPSFNKRLEIGREFEDFAVQVLGDHGLIIQLHRSYRYQKRIGETPGNAWEIKRDQGWRQGYKNLFVEYEEMNTATGVWGPSGIHAAPHPWFFIIGDTPKIWVFDTNILRAKFCEKKYPTAKNGLESASGMLMPVDDANLLAIHVVTPDPARCLVLA